MFGKRDGVKKWRTIEDGHDFKKQEAWFKGRRVVRFLQYGTLSNPHAPSRWRVASYVSSDGKIHDRLKDALAR
jgi:hypothetical protein